MDEQLFSQRYSIRPKEELFDVINDPYCQSNLVENPEYRADLIRLSNNLARWMISQNDLGRETENAAEGRQADWVKSKKQGN